MYIPKWLLEVSVFIPEKLTKEFKVFENILCKLVFEKYELTEKINHYQKFHFDQHTIKRQIQTTPLDEIITVIRIAVLTSPWLSFFHVEIAIIRKPRAAKNHMASLDRRVFYQRAEFYQNFAADQFFFKNYHRWPTMSQFWFSAVQYLEISGQRWFSSGERWKIVFFSGQQSQHWPTLIYSEDSIDQICTNSEWYLKFFRNVSKAQNYVFSAHIAKKMNNTKLVDQFFSKVREPI